MINEWIEYNVITAVTEKKKIAGKFWNKSVGR